ncbi:MAG TPA: acyltransferase, partial [Steroidobacteraceae bacterium]|nr:acyltransferase [Steroidobacteraceae bacterium]
MAQHQGSKIEELESIRGIAAVLVVLFHMPFWNLQLYNTPIIRNSYYMVDLFFVLSGFVMYLNYGDKLRSTRDMLRFQLLRIGRLYPVHLLFLFVALMMAVAKWVASMKLGMTLPNGGAFKDAGLQAFVEQLFLAHALGFSNNALSFNEPSWSISVEFYTYLVFGFVALAAQRAVRLTLCVALSAVSLVLLQYGSSFIGNFSFILQCFAGYFMGCLIAAWCRPGNYILPSWSAFAITVLLLWYLQVTQSGAFSVVIYFISAALIIAMVMGKEGWFRSLLRHRLFTFLGMISYSLYMS